MKKDFQELVDSLSEMLNEKVIHCAIFITYQDDNNNNHAIM